MALRVIAFDRVTARGVDPLTECLLTLDGITYVCNRSTMLDLLSANMRAQARKFGACPDCVDAALFAGGHSRARRECVIPIVNLVDTFVACSDTLLQLGAQPSVVSTIEKLFVYRQRVRHVLRTTQTEPLQQLETKMNKYLSALCVAVANSVVVYHVWPEHLGVACDLVQVKAEEIQGLRDKHDELTATLDVPAVEAPGLGSLPDVQACNPHVCAMLVKILRQQQPVAPAFNSTYLEMGNVVRFATVYACVCEYANVNIAAHATLAILVSARHNAAVTHE